MNYDIYFFSQEIAEILSKEKQKVTKMNPQIDITYKETFVYATYGLITENKPCIFIFIKNLETNQFYYYRYINEKLEINDLKEICIQLSMLMFPDKSGRELTDIIKGIYDSVIKSKEELEKR